MIKYSRVQLTIHCDEAGVDAISNHLQAEPSEVIQHDGPRSMTGYTTCWVFNSPLGHDEGDPISRLEALADSIAPFANNIVSLPLRVTYRIDIVYHLTPQHVGGITGEFNWLTFPAKLVSRISGWGLDVSYECFWFDHPDWQRVNPLAGFRCWDHQQGKRLVSAKRCGQNVVHGSFIRAKSPKRSRLVQPC